MPIICRFYGIVIRMYYNDHRPAHFHAAYGGEEVVIDIETLGVLHGSIPSRALALVTEWASAHRPDLELNWDHGRSGRPMMEIPPLA